MQTKFHKIFKGKKDVIIGAVHFPPLLGYPDFPGFKVALRNALADVKAFENGGADGIIFENNYDIPHKPKVDSSIVSSMTFLGEQIRAATKLPLGVSVLWNDYHTALSLAKVLNLQFIRIPVFVDKVKTECGIIEGQPEEVNKAKNMLEAEEVALFTDIHVKHSKLLSKHDLLTSAKLAIQAGSDAVIITGKLTGQPPDMKELKVLRDLVGDFPILLGSGVDKSNVEPLFAYANGAIVSTSLKEGGVKQGEVNVKSYEQRIDKNKVRRLVTSIKE